ncbi:MGPP2CL-1 [Sanghuangporus sanghuang]|uniref:Protein serine/threonine phosphatase 2C n=1 Tax=Sanghuangporus baumii TaxID=108892 RepID=A0A9Q5I163_SANBA|nr:protein serine/threonine phosphatase 2C [Sanghuangporus baumii]
MCHEQGILKYSGEESKDTSTIQASRPMETRPKFSDSPNARSKSITTAVGPDTHGMLNQHLPGNQAFQVGVHDDKGQRRTMEDAYSFVVDFARIRGQGYFAVFDGHAGKYAAEWCGQHFHEKLLSQLQEHPDLLIPDVLNYTFHTVDSNLSAIAAENDKMHSGCTAVTAFLRIEDSNGKQSFLEGIDIEMSALHDRDHTITASSGQASVPYPTPEPSQQAESAGSSPVPDGPNEERKKKSGIRGKGSQVVSAIKSLAGNSVDGKDTDEKPNDVKSEPRESSKWAITPPADASLRRVLYTANVGDARAVLCRSGRAVRLTYDHKGSDKQEAKRIMDSGGFVMSGRVNGVLAVTRSLGDSSMKDFVVGAPYTTETELGDDDEFLIIACDGLWDVASDQEAVDMVRNIQDPKAASQKLVEHALQDSTDNITAIVVRFLSNSVPVMP